MVLDIYFLLAVHMTGVQYPNDFPPAVPTIRSRSLTPKNKMGTILRQGIPVVRFSINYIIQ